MSVRTTDPRLNGTPSERDLLARLGLGPGASNGEIEAAHDEILDFLAAAPGSLRGWAAIQLGTVDEAYAQLNGAPASASASASAFVPAVPAAHIATPRPVAPRVTGGIDGDDLDGFFDHDDGPVVVTRRERRAAQAQAALGRAAAPAGALTIDRGTVRRLGIGGIAIAAVAAVAFGVYSLGATSLPGITGTPAPQTQSGLDTAAVSADMQKLQANPNDIVTLQDLANLYYAAGDYQTAQTWLQKLLTLDPTNIAALLGSGAASFNLGDDAAAEAAWRKVLTIDSKNVEAHYDLGFMYFSQNPPDVAKVQAEWGAVIALSPDSDIAKTVATHLASLTGSPAPSTAPGASSGPAASAAPVASPAAS